MYYSNDPVADAERYEAEKEEYIKKYPICCNCKEHILDDFCYYIDEEFYCIECMERYFKKQTDYFID